MHQITMISHFADSAWTDGAQSMYAYDTPRFSVVMMSVPAHGI